MVRLLRNLAGVYRCLKHVDVRGVWAKRGGQVVAHSPWSHSSFRKYAKEAGSKLKVCICGAGGCTGQPLAVLLKQCSLIDEIALYDQYHMCGVGLELSHVDTKPKVTAYSGRHTIYDALDGSSVVVLVVRNTTDTFDCSAPIVTEIALQICNACPNCFTIVGTEPVESMVPLIGEIQRLRECYNPAKLLGCTELHCVRANTVLAQFLNVPPETIRVPVIGGCTPQTMAPIFSFICHPSIMSTEQVECLTSCVTNASSAVADSKGWKQATSCYAGAHALARTTINVVKGLTGQRTKQYGYVDSLNRCAPCVQFFNTDVVLGSKGIEEVKGVPELSKFESCLLANALPSLAYEQARAVWLVYAMCMQCCNPYCCMHPCTCYQCYYPCVPPAAPFTGNPDNFRDVYLAKICREMTCITNTSPLCWRPRPDDYKASRAANLTHQLPYRGPPCAPIDVPRSIKIMQKQTKRLQAS